MRFLVDECFPKDLVRALASRGHDVTWATLHCKSADDIAVLAVATAEDRILITEDRDFGTLVFRDGHAAAGIVIVHGAEYPGGISECISEISDQIDAIGEQLAGALTTLEPGRVRQRRIPS